MLIVGLIAAVVLYAALYLLFEWSQSIHIHSTLLTQIQDLLFAMPASTPLLLLKLGIILFAFYIVTDALFSSYRRRRHHK